jgi:hypothetical protein
MSEKRTGSTRRHWLCAGLAVLGIALGSAGPSATAHAADAKAPAAAPASKLDPATLAIVQRMAERIVAAEKFKVGGEIAWTTVQADGQSIEFGATRELEVQRPDRLLMNLTFREGGKRRLLYDGKEVVLQDLDQNVYAKAPMTGPVDDMVGFVSTRLGIRVALGEFLSPELPKLLTEHLVSARSVGPETLDGARCDHVALVNDVGGIQLWVAQDDSLPRQIVITYMHEKGSPQFRARFSGWDLSPQANDATFAFDPPKGAEKIAFARRDATRAKGSSK